MRSLAGVAAQPGKARMGRLDGSVDVRWRPSRDSCEHLLGGRVDDLKRFRAPTAKPTIHRCKGNHERAWLYLFLDSQLTVARRNDRTPSPRHLTGGTSRFDGFSGLNSPVSEALPFSRYTGDPRCLRFAVEPGRHVRDQFCDLKAVREAPVDRVRIAGVLFRRGPFLCDQLGPLGDFAVTQLSTARVRQNRRQDAVLYQLAAESMALSNGVALGRGQDGRSSKDPNVNVRVRVGLDRTPVDASLDDMPSSGQYGAIAPTRPKGEMWLSGERASTARR